MTDEQHRDEVKFLTLLHSKVVKVVTKISIKEPLVEVAALIQGRLDKLRGIKRPSRHG